MNQLKSFFTSQYILWLLLAIPGILVTAQFLQGNARYGMLMHATGEFAGRFLVISLIATPLGLLFPKGKVSRWLIRNRRFFGVAAFAYTLLHTIFYLLEETLAHVVDEFFRIGMITGWVALFIFIPLAATSTDAAIRSMGPNWKKLQRWVYLAAVMTLLHWALVNTRHHHWGPALFHFAPVILLSIYRIWYVYFKPENVSGSFSFNIKKLLKPLLFIAALAGTAGLVGYNMVRIKTQPSPKVNLSEAIKSPSSNAEIEAMRQAMITFRKSLSKDLLARASNDLNSERFLKWHNTPSAGFRGGGPNRDGIYYKDLSEIQLADFKAILQLFLSQKGFQKIEEITRLAEGFLHEKRPNFWNPDLYSIDMFGNPETDGSWGFQLDGHHCAVNFLVHGDNVSMVPAFLGGEPVKATFQGQEFDIFKNERDLGLQLYNGLNDTEKDITESTLSFKRDLQVGSARRPSEPDPYRGNYDYSGFRKGLKYNEMSETTQANLQKVMQEFVFNLNTTFEASSTIAFTILIFG